MTIDKEYFKRILTEKKYEIENVVESMEKHGMSEQGQDSSNELSNYDNHPAELGTQLFTLEMNNALKTHEEHIIYEIDEALKRIEKNTYGKCAFCGREIDRERLEAVPYARLCKACEDNKEIDKDFLIKNRPNEELVLDAPMGRKYLNQQEDDEHEGLDQFNDLMKYGSADSPQDLGGYKDYEEFYTIKVDKQGIVDPIDQISNEDYKRQLPH
ncbi:MAG TPA: conjugal transfer protein TraR [Clostridiaceae bacterium]|nr:conjugal transfer protein TraR [Clostridiaceae bacterium]